MNSLLNRIICKCPALVQILFMERVVQGVRKERGVLALDVTQAENFKEKMREMWPSERRLLIRKRRLPS